MIPLFIDGIVLGLQFSLLAVGLTLIYGLGGVLNLAHGQFAVIAGIVTALLIGAGVTAPLAALLGILAAGAFAFLVDRSLMRPAYRYTGEARLLLGLMLTLGLSLMVTGFLNFRFPQTALSLRLPILSISVFGITIRTASLIVALVALVAILSLLAFLRGTSVGKAIRAVVQNEVGAELCGIDPTKIRSLIFILGGIMAGLAGVAQGLFSAVGTEMGMELTILALIVATVGGVRSINGTLAAGILLGVVNVFASFYIGAYLTSIILLAIAAFTILIRPSGLLGRLA
ncbi:MAG: branched-chain amino acid ABC transporter permease [Dehalococcoidia bacterium]|nr:branched-chain amino acid ABC transporter permease [Dehalococcoidia bacterium]